MDFDFRAIPRRLFGPDFTPPGYLAARWLFLRALGLISFSAFYSLAYQIRGLIGPQGILPAQEYLVQVARVLGSARFWYAPTVFWWSASDRFLMGVVIAGLLASLLLALNIWPRGMLVICLVAFLSFIGAAQDFASYQSDGMLLEAGFISLFFAPSGWRPRWGASEPPSLASRYLLIWLMFRIYFESGIAKILGHDPEWRDFTAMDQYYQNGPLPTWIAWYAHQLPHWFHAATAVLTLALELVLIFAIFLPRRSRIVLFFVITAWQIGIILTSNYAFLNYIVLVLGVLLLDDKFLARFFPKSLRPADASSTDAQATSAPEAHGWRSQVRMWRQAFFLTWIFYATSALLLFMLSPAAPLPAAPVRALEPFRIANEFGLFAVMTRARYEVEFQGSRDGQTWTPYPFRNKPQDVHAPPRIYAPYQPRFDWNLWFASLGNWRQYPWVVQVEERLLSGEPDVLTLFAKDPFPGNPPERIRVILWQYWFTGWSEKREQGLWWRREQIGLYAPTLARTPDGKIAVLEMPDAPPNPP
ncbi:MAG TPA: lipase maturation factor family protein [Candidatus Acidoferrum sp.]|nr:lipase maturation factor family protein [Candidatus Acidoferrum sp.]